VKLEEDEKRIRKRKCEEKFEGKKEKKRS